MAFVDFVTPALEFAKKAVEKDEQKEYQGAFADYSKSAEYFLTAIKHEKTDARKKQLESKLKEILTRMEAIREYLDKQAQEGSGSDGTAMRNKKPGDPSGDEEKNKIKAHMSEAFVAEKPNVKWDDIAGLEGAKEALQEAVILPIRFPQLFTGKREPWKGILLYGPPGTGKSYLAKAVATEADANFYSVSSSTLMSKWLGEAEKQVATLFEIARENAPAIIFVDEIDSMCGARGEGENDAARRVKTEFLVQMQGVGKTNDGVLVLGATNLPYDLDPAIRRRFERRIYIPLPDARARQRMFEIHIGSTPHTLSMDNLSELAEMTDGYSGSDISVLVRNALMEPIRTCRLATHFKRVMVADPENPAVMVNRYAPCSPGDPQAMEMTLMQVPPDELYCPPVTMEDFVKAFRTARPSVSIKDIEIHDRFTEEFGQES